MSAILWGSDAHAQAAPAASESLAVGDWKLLPVFQVRAVGEYRHDIDGRNRGMIFERTRIGLDAQRDLLEVRVVLQDARAVATAATTGFVEGPLPFASTNAFEAWIQARMASPEETYLRVGRQTVTWGEGRLLGAAEEAPAGRSLDAVVGRWAFANASAELLASILEDPTVAGGSASVRAYGELLGIRGEWAVDPAFAVEAYALARVAQSNPADPVASFGDTVQGQTYTGALRLHGEPQPWTWGVEGAYQFGQVDTRAEKRAAWAAAAHIGAAFADVSFKPSLQVAAAYASGDDASTTWHGFDPLLPDVGRWHGTMDEFAWSNEGEASGRVAMVPFHDGVASLEYRYAILARSAGLWTSGYLVTLGRVEGLRSNDLGHEIDATIGWSPWASMDLSVGYSIFFLGDAARSIVAASLPGGSPSLSHFARAQVAVAF